jgi:hypothetical protein
MARFQKGDPKPVNSGRKPGVKNKTTQEIRDAIQKVLGDNVDGLEEDLSEMGSFKKWQILNAVAKYVLPTLNKNDDTVEHSGAIEIVVRFQDPDKGLTSDEDE